MEHTLIAFLEESAERYSDKPLILEKTASEYEGTSYWETRHLVHRFAAGLLALGFERGDRAALVSEGCRLWAVSELGILYAGGISVPLSIKINEPSELSFRISHSGCRIAIVSSAQLHKILQIRKELTALERIVVLDEHETADSKILTSNQVLAMGDDYLSNYSIQFEQGFRLIGENEPANICYTSGTTADPKGVVLTHLNYTTSIEQALATIPIREDDSTLLILPWDHVFAHIAMYAIVRAGGTFASVQVGRTPAETLRNIPVNIREIRPTILLSVPALAQNFRKNIEKAVRQKGPLVEKLFEFILKMSYRYNGFGVDRGKGLQSLKKPLIWFLDALLLKKIREGFGGRMRYFLGAGALLDIELQRFFYAVGIPMYQGYGLTESAPISFNNPDCHKLGSSGQLHPFLELRICDPEGRDLPTGQKGEIVVRSDNVMAGYWNNEKATREALRDGWLHTGDLGYLDAEGFLYVLGREKSLLISNDGEKYSPEGIEEAILASPLIDQIMLYNNQSSYTVALVVPDRTELKRLLSEGKLNPENESDLKSVLRSLQEHVDQFRSGGERANLFPTKWLPSALAILDEGFTEENRMLNSTMKMVRSRITEAHQERIESLLTAEGRDLYSSLNLEALQTLVKAVTD